MEVAKMTRCSIVVILVLTSTSKVLAGDEWTDEWVFPRSQETPVLDRDDKLLMT